MKFLKSTQGKVLGILALILMLGVTVVAVNSVLNDYGGGVIQKVKFTDMDSAEVFVGTINLSMMDEAPTVPIVSSDTSLYAEASRGYAPNFLYYNIWYNGSGTDSTGLVFLESMEPPGDRWIIVDTLKTNDTTGYQGIVELRRKSGMYRVRTTYADITVSGYDAKMEIWFYRPGMDLGYQMNPDKYKTP